MFVQKKEIEEAGFGLAVLMGLKDTAGDVGIEIEVEGNKFQKENVVAPWKFAVDHSLRGQDNAEYVLAKPIKWDKVEDAVTKLWGMMDAYGSVLDDSNRTSVHVHMNAQQFHMNRLASMLALYYTFEELLTEYCGDHRVGNLFCLRAKDAKAIITQVRAFIKSDGRVKFAKDIHHYAGLNTHAIHKYGSLEVRTMRGALNPQQVIEWCSILQRIYERSEDFTDPRGICDLFSAEGPLAFYQSILGDRGPVLRNALDWSDDRIRDSMYEGIRLAQDICYCRDWSKFKPMKLKADPFGRKLLNVAQSMMASPVDASNGAAPAPASWHSYEVEDEDGEYEPEPIYDIEVGASPPVQQLQPFITNPFDNY